MKTTKALTSQLRKDEDFWTWTKVCLPGGFDNPLVKSGVLEFAHVVKYLDRCPDCDECDDMPTPFLRDPNSNPQQWAFVCERSGVTYDCELIDIAVFTYKPDRMAELLCEALDCEGVTRCGDGKLWRLGHSRLKECQEREVVVITQFREEDVKLVNETMQNESFLLIAGVPLFRPVDDQFRRRIFSFDQVVRWKDDGDVYCLLKEFELRLGELVRPKTRAPNVAHQGRLDAIAEYLKTVAFSMLSFDRDAEKLGKAFKENANASEIGRKFKISKGAMSGIITTRKEDGGSPIPQFFFNVCTRPIYFYIFADYVQGLKYTVNSKDANRLYEELVKVIAARKAEKDVIEKIKSGWKF